MIENELFLIEKTVTSKDWQNLITRINDQLNFWQAWKMRIVNENGKIRYFIYSDLALPAMLNNLENFLLKPTSKSHGLQTSSLPREGLFWYHSKSRRFIDLLENLEMRQDSKLVGAEITMHKTLNNGCHSVIYLQVQRGGQIRKCRLPAMVPADFLAVDYHKNQRYSCKGAPKFLDVSGAVKYLGAAKNTAVLRVQTFPYRRSDLFLNLDEYDFAKHSLVLGTSGCGKSKLISLLMAKIHQDEQLRQQYKVVVIDPHASLQKDAPWAKVVDFDKVVMDLFANQGTSVVSATELLLELLRSLVGDRYNSRLERVLRHAIYLLLTKQEFNFMNLRRLLLNLEYRNDVLQTVETMVPISVAEFFLTEFNELRNQYYDTAIAPIIAFIDEMEMVPAFGQPGTGAGIEEILNANVSTIFSLKRTELGDRVTKTIAGLIMQQLLLLVQKQRPEQKIIFIIDEVAVIENEILLRFLAEARKYNLSLVLAGQYLQQFSTDLRQAIFANVINYYNFRLARPDAEMIVDNIEIKMPVDNSREKKVKLLVDQQMRECIARVMAKGEILPAMKAKTIDFEGGENE